MFRHGDWYRIKYCRYTVRLRGFTDQYFRDRSSQSLTHKPQPLLCTQARLSLITTRNAGCFFICILYPISAISHLQTRLFFLRTERSIHARPRHARRTRCAQPCTTHTATHGLTITSRTTHHESPYVFSVGSQSTLARRCFYSTEPIRVGVEEIRGANRSSLTGPWAWAARSSGAPQATCGARASWPAS